MSKIKLVIFDLDGTIIDSLGDLTDATNYMLSEMGREEITVENVRRLVGKGARSLVERALPGFDTSEIDRALDLFLTYNNIHIADKTRLYHGAKETLIQLKNMGYHLAISSNKNESLCQKVMKFLGIYDLFEAVIGADSTMFRKPSPEPLFKLLRDFHVSAPESVMVGDSLNDVAAGKSAGIVTVGCSYGYGERSELMDADYLVSSFSEILDLPVFSKRFVN